MDNQFEVSADIPASPEEVYNAWLDGEKHALMTGGDATGEATEGSAFTAWDGYITGTNLELAPNARIVQEWRTSDFADDQASSRIEVHFTEAEGGCTVRLVHTDIPENQPDYKQGWHDHYFTPMLEYFG